MAFEHINTNFVIAQNRGPGLLCSFFWYYRWDQKKLCANWDLWNLRGKKQKIHFGRGFSLSFQLILRSNFNGGYFEGQWWLNNVNNPLIRPDWRGRGWALRGCPWIPMTRRFLFIAKAAGSYSHSKSWENPCHKNVCTILKSLIRHKTFLLCEKHRCVFTMVPPKNASTKHKTHTKMTVFFL